MVRGWGAITTGTLSSQTLVKPTFAWDATASKYYTLIFVGLSDSSAPAFFGCCFHHNSWYNIEGNDVATGTASGPYAPPGNFDPSLASRYTYFLFQHDNKLSDATVAAAIANATADPVQSPFIFATYVSILGLTDSDLVSVNWWNGKGSVSSMAGALLQGYGPIINPDACAILLNSTGDGVLDMCGETIDTTCNDYATAIEASKAPVSWLSSSAIGLVVFTYSLQAQV